MSQEIEYLYDLSVVSGAGTYYQNTNGLFMTNQIRLSHDYIAIVPTNHKYEYDIVCSIDVGNQFYLGWERYDIDKTARSNNACVYAISVKPTSKIEYKRYKGVIDLSTDGVNPTAFIKLRILNAWSGTADDSTKKAIVHSLSLREFGTSESYQNIQTFKNGQLRTDYFRESYNGASFSKNGFVDGTILYEY